MSILESIFDSLPAHVLMLDGEGTIMFTNRSWIQYIKDVGVFAEDGNTGGNYLFVCNHLHGTTAGGNIHGEKMRAVLRGEESLYQYEYECKGLPSSRWFRVSAAPVRGGSREGAVVMHLDITEQKERDARIHSLAYYDSLTGLPNRLMALIRLQQIIDESELSQCQAAVLTFDMGRFSRINDTIGHAKGDLLLKEFGERLCANVRAYDMVARLGGDRFMVILSGIKSHEDIVRVVRSIQENLQHPYALGDSEYFISTSIGVSVYPKDGADGETLFKHSDSALYKSKCDGQNRVCFYSGEYDSESARRLRLEVDLRHALERNELILHYQPQVDLNSGCIVGAEALMRWQHPEWGLISPLEFIPLAEEAGLIDSIGEWALDTACAQNKAWHDAGLRPIRVAVNVSPHQFHQQKFSDSVRGALKQSGLPPGYLEIEITEGTLMRHTEQTMITLHELEGLGVELSIDDFGTGYSSFSYLKRFPVATLKIDQSFVHEITTDEDSNTIVKAIISMAHSLHLKTIAEGVETEEQLSCLLSHSCDEIQGYLFSRPVPAEAFAQMLQIDGPINIGAVGR